MYVGTSFRHEVINRLKGVKPYEIGQGEKKVCFWPGFLVTLTNLGSMQTRSIFIPEKYVFRVCLESPFTRMISSLKYKWGPPGGVSHYRPMT